MWRRLPLSEDLLPRLCDFISEQWAVDGARSEMHVGDVYVTLYFVMDGNLEESAALWYDSAEKLQAAAFLTGLTFDMVVRPESAASPIAEDMIAWATAELRRRHPGARTLHVQRRPWRKERVAFLEGLGFRRSAQGALALERSLNKVPGETSIEPGFTCRTLRTSDIPSRMRAFTNAFPEEPKSVADYERLMKCDGYEPLLDLVAVDESNEVAAFCSAWFDPVNLVGLFEPVGTCSRHRRKGLARTLMSENLRRLKQLGATSAVVRVRSDNPAAIACYRSLGFSIVSDTFGFQRSIDAAASGEANQPL